MDDILKELDAMIEAGKAGIMSTAEKIHAHQCLREFQVKAVEDLQTARRILEKIRAQKDIQLGVDRDH